MISIENLSKSYARLVVLHDLSFQFLPGRLYGVVGRNGSGKTTLFHCIAGLEAYSGSVSYSGGKLKDVLGFVPTDPYFFPKITGFEYLQLMSLARRRTFNPHDPLLKFFPLPLNKLVESYSTGMKKKLAILGALIQPNEVYIFDEPFNGLDIESNLRLAEKLEELKNENKTVILSSHIFSTLEESCDELFFLENTSVFHFSVRDDFKTVKEMMLKRLA